MWELILKIFWTVFGPIIEADIVKYGADLFNKYIKAKFLKLIGKG